MRNKHIVLLLASTLAGCTGVTVMRSEINAGYTGALYAQTQAQTGTNSVIVRNSPVPPQAVVDALQARYQGNQYRFALGPNPPDWNGYTIVMSFGGPVIGNQTLCQNLNTSQLTPAAGVTEIVGNYCYGDRLVVEASGRSPAITSPQDPHFQELVGGVVAEFFRTDPNVYDRGSSSPPH